MLALFYFRDESTEAVGKLNNFLNVTESANERVQIQIHSSLTSKPKTANTTRSVRLLESQISSEPFSFSETSENQSPVWLIPAPLCLSQTSSIFLELQSSPSLSNFCFRLSVPQAGVNHWGQFISQAGCSMNLSAYLLEWCLWASWLLKSTHFCSGPLRAECRCWAGSQLEPEHLALCSFLGWL